MKDGIAAIVAAIGAALAAPATAIAGDCEEPVGVYRDGAPRDRICAEDAPAAGLTIVDLSPTWTPAALAPGPDGVAPAYRATYLALADGRFDDAGDEGPFAAYDRTLEVYGIVPALAVIGGWLSDDARHRCHAAIDREALQAVDGTPREESAAAARGRQQGALDLRAALEREVAQRELADLDALAATSASRARKVARLRAAETYLQAIGAAQAHLACDGLLEGEADQRFGWRTSLALAAFQRRNLLVPSGRLDADTRAALVDDSRARDHRAALRALRERVVTATGLIEDGSAGGGNATVLGHRLDPPGFDHVLGHDPLPDAAPDRIAAATEVAARALGWIDPAATARFLAGAVPARVAIALPPLPDRAGQTLAVEIDRGDVWYDPTPRVRPVDRRPALILYAVGAAGRTPLVRWPTTIGGWQDERRPSGAITKRWKESPVGARVWRELHVAPTWLPPPSTPDDDLVHPIGGGRFALTRALMGPSYRSAYGLAMLIHERPRVRRGIVHYDDQGVRTHGSGNVGSIDRGHSHGCHRLLPAQALRLAGFLVHHQPHVRHGEIPTVYTRLVRHHGVFPLRITTRGYRFELTPPLPVEVLPGRIRSKRKTPPR